MIVRRLKALGSPIAAWIARVFESVLALVPGRRSAPRTALVSAPAAPSAPNSPATPTRPPYLITNWLDDARRLRGRPAPRAVPLHPATAMLRQVLRDPHWTSAFEAGRLAPPARPPRPLDERAAHDAAREGTPDISHETLRALPHRPPAPPTGPAPSPGAMDPSSAGARGEAESHRRLLLIRELVRRGLYNEGFKPGHIPDQYRPRPTPPGSATSGAAEPPAE